ncbi:MAG: helix-turn-helix domain-containing protein [Patescibacteria group bacterium]
MENISKLLNLTSHEEKIFTVLDTKEPFSVSDTSKKAKIPRMSAYLALAALKSRGIIYSKIKGKRRFWLRISDKELSDILISTAKLAHDSEERVEITHDDSTGFAVLRGLPSLFSIFERIAQGHKDERLIGIQPTASLKNVLRGISWKNLQPIQDSIRNNKIIVEGLLREDYYPTLTSLVKDPVQKEEILKSFIGRTTDMVFVSNEYLNAETELMMFRDVAFLINWKDEVALEIKNKDMLHFLKELFDLARGYGRKVNQEEYIKNIIEKINHE